MRQDQKSCTSIIVARKKIRERAVGKVPDPRHHPLLYRPRIRPLAQHFEIVIRFDHQRVATLQVIFHTRRHVSKIGRHAHLDALGLERESTPLGRNQVVNTLLISRILRAFVHGTLAYFLPAWLPCQTFSTTRRITEPPIDPAQPTNIDSTAPAISARSQTLIHPTATAIP